VYVAQGADRPIGVSGTAGIVDVSTRRSRCSRELFIGRTTTDPTSVVVVDTTAYVTAAQCEFGLASCWGELAILEDAYGGTDALGVYTLKDIPAAEPRWSVWYARTLR
jgi:hypothetical protein